MGRLLLGRTERIQYLKTIEQNRGSRVLVLCTGDRQGLETRIAFDVLPFVFEHLTKMGKMKKLDLFMYSPGGLTMAGYGLANLVSEFCESFNAIVPFKALSTATLIALGAEEILMTKFGQLSPIDPSVEHVLGPLVKVSATQEARVPINVEDALSYLDLARDKAQLKDEESMSKVFDHLSSSVHPLALGAVNRVREQIRFLARNLLSRHMKDDAKVTKIVDILTKERFSHDYLISRREAKDDLRLNIVDIDPKLEQRIVDLYLEYDGLMQLRVPYNPEIYLGPSDQANVELVRAVVESDDLTHVFRTVKQVNRLYVQPPGVLAPVVAYRDTLLSERWEEDHTI